MNTVEEQLILSPVLSGVLMTPQEFDAADDWDENYRYELINGVLAVSPPPDIGESGSNDELGHLLRTYRDQPGSVLNYTTTEHTIHTKTNRRCADRVVWAGFDAVPDTDEVAPTIAVEFVSQGRRNRERDYQAKRQEYMEIDVAEYWIIDRFQRTTTVVKKEKGEIKEIVLGEDDVYSTPTLPGFELPVGRLFEESDITNRARKKRPKN